MKKKQPTRFQAEMYAWWWFAKIMMVVIFGVGSPIWFMIIKELLDG